MISRLSLLWIFVFCSEMAFSQAYFTLARVDNVKLRSCPDINCPVLYSLPQGSRLEIVDVVAQQELGGYGLNAWLRVFYNGEYTFVYGAVTALDLPSEAFNTSAYDAYSWQGEANVRLCPSLKCNILFRLEEGEYFKVVGVTPYRESVGELGQYHWLIIEYRGRRGFLWGGLAKQVPADLSVIQDNTPISGFPEGPIIGYVNSGQQFVILKQTIASKTIRPMGRNFWYQVSTPGVNPFWIYGGYSDRQGANVDCQCVDYVKNTLSINGPTNNATDWGAVLTGQIQVIQKGSVSLLNYRVVYPPQIGDFAVFKHTHPEVHPEFGHIGYVSDFKLENGIKYVEITGANHPLPISEWFTQQGCYNVSKMWYLDTNDIEFYR